MLSKIQASFLQGIEGAPVWIETDISRGMPGFHIVGQPDTTIKEARERIRPALYNAGMEYPYARITINISPAGLRKRGSQFDLAIAVGILTASGQLPAQATDGIGFLGELSLDGALCRTDGILPMVMALKRSGLQKIILPEANLSEAGLVSGVQLYPAHSLRQVADHLQGAVPLTLAPAQTAYRAWVSAQPETLPDYADVHGQERAKRAILLSVAGGHGLLMTGSPATGKTMLAERMPTIMPEMSFDEILETTAIYSVAGLLRQGQPQTVRPFRQPHVGITAAGLLGGGTIPRPGEITLASQGVLFLDEISEFDPNLIDALRTPLEKRSISLVRRGVRYTFPADFILVAATNPCKCGYFGDVTHPCKCTEQEVERYQRKLSGPILDRIDLHVRLQPVSYQELHTGETMSSAEMRALVGRARRRQAARFAGSAISLNRQLDARGIDEVCPLDGEKGRLMAQAYERMRLNPRTLLKIRRIARTIADVENSETVELSHLTEALAYREDVR